MCRERNLKSRSPSANARATPPSCLLGILPHDDRVGDLDHLVGREVRLLSVLADLLRARSLVDADRADRAAVLLEHVAADPPHVVRHLVADLIRPARRDLQLLRRLPGAAAQNHICIHEFSPSRCGCADLVRYHTMSRRYALSSKRSRVACPSCAAN